MWFRSLNVLKISSVNQRQLPSPLKGITHWRFQQWLCVTWTSSVWRSSKKKSDKLGLLQLTSLLVTQNRAWWSMWSSTRINASGRHIYELRRADCTSKISCGRFHCTLYLCRKPCSNITEVFEHVNINLQMCYTFNSRRVSPPELSKATGRWQGLELMLNVNLSEYALGADAGSVPCST